MYSFVQTFSASVSKRLGMIVVIEMMWHCSSTPSNSRRHDVLSMSFNLNNF